mmetsp:Transcript_6823/g.5970  ORF Transcript_6823/g.5970 Transcript_6823/m.5970 type:complete len:112 (+) Transcript_6823:154-489(+)
MQMSVVPHQDLYGAPQKDSSQIKMLYERINNPQKITAPEGKSIVKSNSNANVKVYESKRRKKLNKLSGSVGKNQPYRAPVFLTYTECFKSLKNQGVLGFYKGNFMRQSSFF